MSQVLVIGGNGQLATALAEAGGPAVRRLGRPALDFDRLEEVADAVRAALRDAVGEGGAVVVVNAAAWTAVDAAEAEPDAARRANEDGPALLAAACAEMAAPLIHVSTDYVFDGLKGAPYVETDPPSPTGVYGATKLAGERAVLAAHPQAVVLRTSWVYSATGRNFVRTMLGAKAPRLRVVADQQGCPTAAADLADAVLTVAGRLGEGWRDEYAGVFHAAGAGSTTWHGFAAAIFEEAARHGRPVPAVDPIATADWPTPARRPPDSRLDCGKLRRVFGVTLPRWRPSLARVVDALLAPGLPAGSPRG